MPKRTILLFEDDPNEAPTIEASIKKECKGFRVATFCPPKDVPAKPYEDVLKESLRKGRDDLALIVTDRDLSRTDRLGGLSEAAVSKVAQEWALPICLYARTQEPELLRQLKWGEGRISASLEKGPAALAREVYSIARGFEDIRRAIEKMPGTALGRSPGKILATILRKPGLADRLSLYGAGDQQMLAEILPYFGTRNREELKRRMPRVLGNWLWESILRFPGILLNSKASASYLNIDPHDFEGEKVRSLFLEALYRGPFSRDDSPYWWRHELDALLDGEGVQSGLELARRVNKAVQSCRCSVDPSLKAGYYCIVTNQPVSAERSRGNLSWLPSGADLSRISEKQFQELAPWLALY